MLEWSIIGILIIIILLLLYYVNKHIWSKKQEWDKVKKEINDAKLKAMRELELTISEEKEKSINRIHQAEKESWDKIRETENKIYNDIESRKQDLIKKLDQDIINYKELNKQKLIELDNQFEEEKAKIEEKRLTLYEQINLISETLQQMKSKQSSIVESFKRAEKLKDKDNFNKISFTPEEVAELDELESVIRKLRNPLPFRKAVYDIYYKPKVNDLVLRVVGRGRVSGIYKITHIGSGKCYVGQSVDIGERWKQHAKRGTGAEQMTTNKLYPAMLELRLENFTFEVIETTEDTSRLNEMEKYWQDFFQAKEFGFSMK